MTTGPLTSDKRFALLLWDVGRLLRKAIDAHAAQVGMTSAQWHLLSTLARCEKSGSEAPNQATLAELLDVEPITLSRQIDRLTAAGMIKRTPDPADRRAYRLHLTEKAWPLVLQFREVATEVLGRAMAGVAPGEIDEMIGSLERIRSNLTGKPETVATAAAAPPKTKTRSKEGAST